MTNLQTLIIVLAIVAAVAVITGILVPFLRKRGVDLDKVLTQTQNAINTASTAFALVKPFIDDKQSVDVVDKVFAAANTGVGNAEQLCKLSKIDKEERHAAAVAYVHDTLKLTGIEITPEIEALTEGAIQASVNALGHKVKTVPLEIDGTTLGRTVIESVPPSYY